MDSNLTDLGYVKESSYALASSAGVRATGTFTLSGQPANTETVTINAKVYTFKTVLTAADGDVFIGATLAASALNLIAAITLAAGGSGIQYGSGTTKHTTVTAATGGAGIVKATSLANGTGSNAYGTTDTVANGAWAAATLLGGLASTYATKSKFRFKSESLKHDKETVADESIRSDRQVDELIQVGVGGGGSIETELYLNDELWVLMCSALMGVEQIIDYPISTTFSLANQTLAGVANSIVQGARLIRILGAANAGNSGLKTVLGYLGGNVLQLAPGSITANETTLVTIRARYVRNGTQLDSYLLEKYGVTLNTYMQYLGMVIDSYGITMEAKKKITQTFGWLGYGGQRTVDSGALASAAAGSGGVLTGSNSIGALLIDGATPVSSIKKLGMGIKNNLRARGALARLGTLVPGTGSSDVTGNIEAYFDDTTNLDKFLNHSSAAIQGSMVAKDTMALGFHYPSVSFPEGNWNVGGLNQDIMIPLAFKAVRDAVLGYQVQLDYPNPTA